MMVSITQLQEIPSKSMILLVGPPGSGKTVFCQQSILKNLAVDRPIIYVTTECGPSEAEKDLRERGLGEIEPGLLNFVDAYNETVGLSVSDRPDTARADCDNLSSIGIAISKLSNRIGRRGVLLVFDSLTSSYLFTGSEVLRFMKRTLSRFAGEGNSVLVCFDEGSGKEEDLVGMMSLSNGVIKMEVKEGRRGLNVVKHPVVEPTRIEVPTTKIGEKKLWDMKLFDREMARRAWDMSRAAGIRTEIGDHVSVFWPNFAFWSAMVWDPKRFPEMRYELTMKGASELREWIKFAPLHMRLLFKLSMPKSFSKVKDMKKMAKYFQSEYKKAGVGITEYLEEASNTDEHYFRINESSECWGFENVGATMASMFPPYIAGLCKGLEKEEREWNAVETKCIGLGDPYCEFKVVPRKIDGLRGSLEKDRSVVERINEGLMQRLMGFLLHGKPLVERPRLGSDVHMEMVSHVTAVPAMAGERYRMALRMGGAKAGKKVGEHLKNAGLSEDDAVKRILSFLEHCKVGKIAMDGTIRMWENCESLYTKLFWTKRMEPSCYFTTGFLSGFFCAVKNHHIKETKCIAMGDPYCEWEFR
jgi:predicted hydrocarbon binding protein/KaiC/GvpD/RAD55 family RecA-like ATPase